MDADTMNEYRQRLASLREKILGELVNLEQHTMSQSLREQSGDLSGYAIHLADAASDSYDRDFNLALASREQDILNDIDAALEKIENGEYGTCEKCGHPISSPRLKAVPYARLCLPCKERQEKSQAQG
jgi:RNA polymerase-binding protein DksA